MTHCLGWREELCRPTTEKIVKIADYFNLSVDYILGISSVKEFITVTPPTAFANRLSQLMVDNKVIGYHLNKVYGIGKSTITAWLQGSKCASLEHIVKLMEILHCSADYILGRSR